MTVETYAAIGGVMSWIFVFAASAALMTLAFVLFDSWIIRPRIETYVRLGQTEAAAQIQRDSYWFSEDPPTMWLLQKMSAELLTNGAFSASQIRDEWRSKTLATGAEPK